MDIADFLGFADMGATAGLAIDSCLIADANQPYIPRSAWRLHVFRLYDFRIGVEFGDSNPLRENRVVPQDDLHHFTRDVFLVDAGFRKIEIYPRLGFAHMAVSPGR